MTMKKLSIKYNQRSVKCVWSNCSICFLGDTAIHRFLMSILISIILVKDSLNKFTTIPSSSRKHFTINILVDYPSRASVWCDGMSVITMATDLPHEMEAKSASKSIPTLEINWHRRRRSWRKAREKPHDQYGKSSSISKAIAVLLHVLLLCIALKFWGKSVISEKI